MIKLFDSKNSTVRSPNTPFGYPMLDWDGHIYGRLVRQIYEAANNPENWNDTVRDIGHQLKIGFIHLMLVSHETGFEYIGSTLRGDQDFDSEKLKDIALEDYRRVMILSQPTGVAFDDRLTVSEEHKRTSPISQDFLPRRKIYNIMSANMSFGDCEGWFGVTTRRSSEDFSDEQKTAFQRLLPYLLQSMRITKTNIDLQMSNGLAFNAVEELSSGVFQFLNQQIVNVNRAGKGLLKEGFFVVQNGELACRLPKIDRLLRNYLEQTDQLMPGPILLRDRSSKTDYCVRRHNPTPHFCHREVGESAGQLVTITKLRGAEASLFGDVEGFAQFYRLSEAEFDVLYAVLNYETLKELAEKRGVNLDTVRKQLKSVMAKVDVASQKELFQMFERYRILGS